MRWSKVVSDARYINSSPEEQLKIREDWYDFNIKSNPQYKVEDDEQIRQGLFGDISILEAPTPKPSTFFGLKRRETPLPGKSVGEIAKEAAIITLQTPMKLAETVMQQLSKPIAAVRYFMAGEDPRKAISEPEKAPPLIDFQTLKYYGIDKLGPNASAAIGATVETFLEVALYHGLYRKVPEALNERGASVAKAYSGVVGKEVVKLKSTMVDIFKAAGMDEASAKSLADVGIAKEFAQKPFMSKTPMAVKATCEFMEANKDKLAANVKSNLDKFKSKGGTEAVKQSLLRVGEPTEAVKKSLLQEQRDIWKPPVEVNIGGLKTNNEPHQVKAEALKYKTAEEFVESIGEVYHGTLGEFEDFLPATEVPEEFQDSSGVKTFGTYFTDNKELAKQFGDKIKTGFINKNKLLDLTTVKSFDDLVDLLPIDQKANEWELQNMVNNSYYDKYKATDGFYKPLEDLVNKFNLVSKLKEMGYEGLIYNDVENGVKGKTFTVFEPKNIKTKSQLTQIWNEAHQQDQPKVGEITPTLPVGSKVEPKAVQPEIITQNIRKNFINDNGDVVIGENASKIIDEISDDEFLDISGVTKDKFKSVGGSVYFVDSKYKDLVNSIDKNSKEIILSKDLKNKPEELKKTFKHELTHWKQIGSGNTPKNFYVDLAESIEGYMDYLSDPAEVEAQFKAEGKTNKEYENFMEQLNWAKSEEAGKLQPFEIGETKVEIKERWKMTRDYLVRKLKNIDKYKRKLKLTNTEIKKYADEINKKLIGDEKSLINIQSFGKNLDNLGNTNVLLEEIKHDWVMDRLMRNLQPNEIETVKMPVLRIEVRGKISDNGKRNNINPIIIESEIFQNKLGIKGLAVGPNEIDVDLDEKNIKSLEKLQKIMKGKTDKKYLDSKSQLTISKQEVKAKAQALKLKETIKPEPVSTIPTQRQLDKAEGIVALWETGIQDQTPENELLYNAALKVLERRPVFSSKDIPGACEIPTVELTPEQTIKATARVTKKRRQSVPSITPKAVVENPAVADDILNSSDIAKPETLVAAQAVKSTPANPTSNPVPELEPEVHYNVSYLSSAGVRETIMSSSELEALKKTLASGKAGMDTSNTPVFKINDVWGMNTKDAFLNLQVFYDALTNIKGSFRRFGIKASTVAKKLGTPALIAEKYPPFQSVYGAVDCAFRRGQRMITDGYKLTNWDFLNALSSKEWQKPLQVLWVGNDNQWIFSDHELLNTYKLNPLQIKAYHSIRRGMDYMFNITVEAKRIELDFLGASAEEKAAFEKKIQDEYHYRKGNINQMRAPGPVTVFQPPVEGEKLARWFQMYQSDAEAKAVAKSLGPDAIVYDTPSLLKDSKDEFHKYLSIGDLESLIDAADVDTTAPEIEKIRKEIKKRGIQAQWLRKMNVPGIDRTDPKFVIQNTIDGITRAARIYSRTLARVTANKALLDNAHLMSPGLREYAEQFLQTYYNTGNIGYATMGKVLYVQRLALRTSQLGNNLVGGFFNTWPAIAERIGGLGAEKVFTQAGLWSMKYQLYKLTGDRGNLPTSFIKYMNTLHDSGEFSDQLTRFQLDVRQRIPATIDSMLGLFMRVGEGMLRPHAAAVDYIISSQYYKVTDKNLLIECGVRFINKTQYAYKKHNIPLCILRAGDLKHALKTMYTFRHFPVSFLQRLNALMPWRGAPVGASFRALVALLALAGIKGLPLMGLIELGWKNKRGRTFEEEYRTYLMNHDVPEGFIDFSLRGSGTLAGVDTSASLGAGDVVPTYGSAMEAVIGAPAGIPHDIGIASAYFAREDYERGLESLMPSAVKNPMKAMRTYKHGYKGLSGELVYQPTKAEAVKQALGYTPLGLSKAYAGREATSAIEQKNSERTSYFYQEIAKAHLNKDSKRKFELLRQARQEHIRIDVNNVMTWIRRGKGKVVNEPRKFRREFRRIRKLYREGAR